MLAQDRRLTLRLIAEELGISKDTAHIIVRDYLGKRKICSRFVPHKLTDEQKAKRMETSGDFISLCDHDPLLWKTSSREMTPDATSSQRNQNGNRCRGVHRPSPRPKKNRLQKSKVKTLLIAFFDNKGIIHKKNLFLPVKPLTPHFTRQF